MFWECSTSSYDVPTFWLMWTFPVWRELKIFPSHPSHPPHNNWVLKGYHKYIPNYILGLVVVQQFHSLHLSRIVGSVASIPDSSFILFHSSLYVRLAAYECFGDFQSTLLSLTTGQKLALWWRKTTISLVSKHLDTKCMFKWMERQLTILAVEKEHMKSECSVVCVFVFAFWFIWIINK